MKWISTAMFVLICAAPAAAQKRGDTLTDAPDRETQIEQLQHALTREY